MPSIGSQSWRMQLLQCLHRPVMSSPPRQEVLPDSFGLCMVSLRHGWSPLYPRSCSSAPLPWLPCFPLLVLAGHSPPWPALKLTYFPNVTSKEGSGASQQHGASPPRSPSCLLLALDQIHPVTLWWEGLLPRSLSQPCRRPGPTSSSILLLRGRLLSSASHILPHLTPRPLPSQTSFCPRFSCSLGFAFHLCFQLSCLLFLFSSSQLFLCSCKINHLKLLGKQIACNLYNIVNKYV